MKIMIRAIIVALLLAAALPLAAQTSGSASTYTIIGDCPR
jgi:hypothetical protein